MPDKRAETARPRAITIADLYAFRLVGSPEISPDGARCVVVVQRSDLDRNTYYTDLHLIDLDSGEVSDQIPSPKITPVDTTGAGDAFLASLAYRLASGDDLSTACAFAVRVGAYAATGEGAQKSYPTADQLENWAP